MESPFTPDHFGRYDDTPDELFYRPPRLVKHIDDAACAALADFYRTILPPGGAVLDLMSSWVSHYPDNVAFDRVIAHGMNATELAANERATGGLVANLNSQPLLPFRDAVFDACTIAVSVQYLTQPMKVFAEVGRVLRPGAPFCIAWSNRCFPTKAVAIWQALREEQKASLINMYFEPCGLFDARTVHDISPNPGQSDPLYVIVGNRQS